MIDPWYIDLIKNMEPSNVRFSNDGSHAIFKNDDGKIYEYELHERFNLKKATCKGKINND